LCNFQTSRMKHAGHTKVLYVENSILLIALYFHLREFLDVEITVERLMYAYQYMTASEALNFRYDNTGHHKPLNLPTYPHHKHEGSEDHVIASHAPELADVLQEIELLVKLS